MKKLLRILLALLLIGLVTFTIVVEQAKAAVRKKMADVRVMQSQRAPVIEAMRAVQKKRLGYHEHLLFLQYPLRLSQRLARFLCQLDRLAATEMKFASFSAQADANGFRFFLTGIIRGASAETSAALFQEFKGDVETMEGFSEITKAETSADPGNPSLLSFVLNGTMGLE